MVQKMIWIILVGVIYFAENCHGNNISIQADDRGFGYEILQFQFDHLANSLNSMSKELDKVKETNIEMSKIFMEKQTTLMEQLISTIANNTNQNKVDKQFKMMEQLLNSLAMIANNTGQNKVSNELVQLKDAIKLSNEKQSSSMERLISSIANNTSQNKIADELAQIKNLEKISIEKQSSSMHQLLKIANNTNEILDNTISKRNQEIHSCKSARSTGLYRLICDNCPPDTRAYCEMGSFGGGWIVIQQRLDGSVNFTRNWHEYRNGFGTVGESTEFWLGLELIHQLTNSGGDYELAVELKDENGKYGYVIYSEFKIAGEKEKYRLSHLGQDRGTISDYMYIHKGGNFSTFDQDNDKFDDRNCSLSWWSGGGWWCTCCNQNFLNGSYEKNKNGFGIDWYNFTKAATFSRMMIRRK